MNTDAMHAVLTRSEAGEMVFPEVVRQLMEVGVESYFVDSRTKTLYLSGGQIHIEQSGLPVTPVAEAFSKEGIVAAIRAAQRDEVRYPEFMRRAADSGVIGYWAFLTGRKVIYFGRKGEMHEELFPSL